VSGETSVQRASDQDFGDLIVLRYRWRTEEAGETGMSLDEFDRRCREWLVDHRATHRGYVARTGGHPIGCAWLCLIDRVPGPGKFERRGGILQSVYVEPSSRDTGVGTELVGVMLEDARLMGLDYVMVHPSKRSFAFYRRLGFTDADGALELRLDASG